VGLAILLPLIYATIEWVWPGWTDDDISQQLSNEQRAEVSGRFIERLDEALLLTERAHERSPRDAFEEQPENPWMETLEGVGLADGPRGFVRWWGSPTDAGEATDPDIRLVREGTIQRLILRAGPNILGLSAWSTFTFSFVGEEQNSPWLPAPPAGGRWRTVRVVSPGEEPGPTEPGNNRWTLKTSEGLPLLEVLWEPATGAARTRAVRRTARALTALLWLPLIALLAGPTILRGRGFPTAISGTLLTLFARQLIEWAHVSDTLFSPGLGEARWFGSSLLGHWLESPIDLVFTTAALLIAGSFWLRGFPRERSPKLHTGLRSVFTLALAAAGWHLTRLFAIHSPLDILNWDDARPRIAAAMLWLTWAAILVALAGLISGFLPTGKQNSVGFSTVRRVAGIVIPLAFLSAVGYDHARQVEAIAQAERELIPQVLGPSEERKFAVEDAVDNLAVCGEQASAFDCWRNSELGRRGFRSAVTILDEQDIVLSTFSFGMGTFRETPGSPPPPGTILYRDEELPIGSLNRPVAHAERIRVRADGKVLRIIVHVLETPDNLPFLTAGSPFLQALNPGTRSSRSKAEYILFDRRGEVRVQTIAPAPKLTTDLEKAATRSRRISLQAGSNRYTALPRLDGDRLHLILLRQRSWTGRTARGLRLTFATLAILSLVTLLRSLRTEARRHWWRHLSGSFYRKLLLTLLIASVPPLIGLVFLVQGFLERRAEAELQSTAVRAVRSAQKGIEDYMFTLSDGSSTDPVLDDDLLDWLSRLVGRTIHVYRDGRIEATSQREWFDSGLIPITLPGHVHDEIVRGGAPSYLSELRVEQNRLPVAFAPLRGVGARTSRIVAVPLDPGRREADRTLDRVAEALLITTAGLVALLAFAAAAMAQAVSRPVRALVEASERLARGDYSARASTPARDELRELVHGFNTMADALERQRADLEQRREYIETLLGHATTGIASIDSADLLVTVNPAMDRVLGLAEGSLKPGEPWTPRLEKLGLDPKLRRRLAGSTGPWLEAEELELDHGAERRRLRLVQVQLPAAGGPGHRMILIDDLTDVMRSNQLSAWAEMARAIAHEIKNPLTPIQLSTEHLRRLLVDRGVLPHEDLDRCLETVLEQVQALRQIASEFNAYARIPALTLRACDPADVLREALAPYCQAPPQGIRIMLNCEPAPDVPLDRKPFVRALVNLIENALHAMPDGGTLTAGCRLDGTDVLWTIEDSGTGLDEETRRRLFEPYFSTKSSGTGLGLAIVRRTIEAHHGTIEAESEPDKGARFRLRVPLAEDTGA
jgi:signal transduction histidine kinase